MKFTPCVSRHACTDGGSHCRSCGRSHEEVARTRQLTGQLVQFMLEMDYDNSDEFIDYVAGKVRKKIKARLTSE
jgi:hypothetical protein